MSEGQTTPTTDMVRWTFTARPDRRAEVEAHLADLGLDVHIRGEGQFIVTWEEPDDDLEAVVEELWQINGEPFEVTHEEFHRVNLLVFHSDDDAGEPGRAVA